MKVKHSLLIAAIFVSCLTFGQEPCNCLDNLQEAILKTEENYAGFPDKIKPANKTPYDQLKNNLKIKAIDTDTPLDCYLLLKEYVNFFYDKHFRIEYNAEIDSSVISDIDRMDSRLGQTGDHSIEGIWRDVNNTEISIIRHGENTYKAVKRSSENDHFPKGFVYFTLTKNRNDFSTKLYNRNINIDIPAKKTGNLLRIWNFQLWAKTGAALSKDETEELESWRGNNNGLLFKKLNADFSYLKIPTFENNEGVIHQLVTESDSAIKNTKYLIIDLRGNGGGSSGWVSLIPYLATNQIDQGETYLRVSKENVSKKLQDLDAFANHPIPEDYKKYFPEEILNRYKETYRELPETTETFYPLPSVSFPLDSVLTRPAKVAILVDEFGGSSTEYFFYLARQSKKAITYGRPTIGMMDYAGMSNPTKLPFDAFRLYIPIEKSAWTDENPIDKTGFTPQIMINREQENWIDYVMEDLPKM
ncbi:S41 family peptidase [Parapedobacter indicus]|uniref:Peptidase family S41 n=1 Tax=Parapedobacter indicus TaxID=1477437 RepID=A0A1I3CI38_9SPHI|nr:S41 family peptidase [Parapedobacter indicus]PPL04254.1 peptidase S41-like protein [Parapedobacter indicus]SFH74003.1 Peptidase family S41 [Parapedobacter indicus]